MTTDNLENKILPYHIQKCLENKGFPYALYFNGKYYCSRGFEYCQAQRKSNKPAPYCGKK